MYNYFFIIWSSYIKILYEMNHQIASASTVVYHRALGFAATRGKLYYRHPELFKVNCWHCSIKRMNLFCTSTLVNVRDISIMLSIFKKIWRMLLLLWAPIFYWFQWPVASILLIVWGIVSVVLSVVSFSNHRPCPGRYGISQKCMLF